MMVQILSSKPKKIWEFFSHFLTQMSSDLEIRRDELWTQSEKVLDNTSVDHLRPVLASPMLSYAKQGQKMDGWLQYYIGSY
jgi:hypothetical protein